MTEKKIVVLLGDIGGTNSRLRLVYMTKDSIIETIDEKDYPTYKYKGLKEILKEYLSPFKNKETFPKLSVLGIPGAVINNRVLGSYALPDLNGKTGTEMGKELGIEYFMYLNDFNVNGYAIQNKNLKEGIDYISLTPNIRPIPNATKCMIGAGTGLGTGFLTKKSYDKYYTVNSAQGGQQDFPINSDLQLKYKEFLSKFYNVKNPTCENACCGSTITLIYKFICNEEKIKENDSQLKKNVMELKEDLNNENVRNLNKKIIDNALYDKCPLCKRVLDFFIEIYASITANLALVTLSLGGVYLFGGVSAGIGEYMKKNNIFVNNFIHKGGMELILETIPIYAVINEKLGIIGAGEYARQAIEDGRLDIIFN